MSKPKRYIVVGDRGALQVSHYNDTPKASVLIHGDTASMFRSYSTAARAIQRTKKYESAKRFTWNTWKLKVVRLEEYP